MFYAIFTGYRGSTADYV